MHCSRRATHPSHDGLVVRDSGRWGFFRPKRQRSKKRLVLDGFMTPLHLEVYPWGYLGTRARDLVHSG